MGNCLNKSRRQVKPSITVEARISAKTVKRESKKIFNFRKYSARDDVQNDDRKTDKETSANDGIVIEDLTDQHVSDSVLVSVCSHSVLQEVKHIEHVDTPNSLATQRGSPYYASNESIYEEFTDAGDEVEEEIDEHEEDDIEYLPNAVRASPKEDNRGIGELGSGKVLLDINQIEKAIKRLYSLNRETSKSNQQTIKEECSDKDVTSAYNNEDIVAVSFDDRSVLDDIPDNSEHRNISNTQTASADTPRPTLKKENVQEDGMGNTNKTEEDNNCLEKGNSELSVSLPEGKLVNALGKPFDRSLASSYDGSSELDYIPDNTEHPDVSNTQCITKAMSMSALNSEKVLEDGVRSADKITEDKNWPENYNSGPLFSLSERKYVDVAIMQLDRITKQKTESQESVVESFDRSNILDNLSDNSEHPDMSNTSSLIECTPKSSLNEEKSQENGMTSSDKIREAKKRLENENSLLLDLPKYKSVKSSVLPSGRITQSETSSKENVVVSSNDRSVLYNIHDNYDNPDVLNTSSLIRDTPTTTLIEENAQKDEKGSADNTREDKKCLNSGDSRPLASSDSVGVSDMHSVDLSNSVNDCENLNVIKTKPEKDIVYTQIKKDNTMFNEFRLKSLISLTSIKSLEKVKNHGSRSDCEFSVYVRSSNVNEMPRLIQVRASNKQIQDGVAKNFIKLRKDISEPLQFFDSLPDDKKKTKMRLQTCSSLIEKNTAVQWTEIKGPSANAQLTTVPEFHMPAPKLKTVRETLGLDKLQKYGIIPQCREIERIKLDEDEFPAILPPKIRRKWTKKKNEKKFVN